MKRKLLKLFAFLIACSLSSSPLIATTYYVNIATGSDTNNGTSPQTAFKYVTKAMSVALSGDTILVAPGTYPWALPPC